MAPLFLALHDEGSIWRTLSLVSLTLANHDYDVKHSYIARSGDNLTGIDNLNEFQERATQCGLSMLSISLALL